MHPTKLPENLARRLEKYLELLKSVAGVDRRLHLEECANIHTDIARVYANAGLPWAIPHYREALRCWEQTRSLVNSVQLRLQMLEQKSHSIYYPLFFAYLRELERPRDWQPPSYPSADARWQREFAEDDLPNGLAQLRQGNALVYAYHILEAARARTFVDRLQIRHSDRGLEAPSLEKMALILDPQSGREPAALITWLCAEQETHIFRLTADRSLKHIRVPITAKQIDDVVGHIWNDQHHRLFNVVHPRTKDKPSWQLLQNLSSLIAPVVQDLEPGTPLVLEPHRGMARLPLGLLPMEKGFIVERHPLALISCHAHLLAARHRNPKRRLKVEAEATDRIIAVGVGRSASERRRCDFDPLGRWSDAGTAPPGLYAEPLLWESATLSKLKEHLPGHRFCAFTCHGHYQHLDVEDSGLLLHGDKLDLQALSDLELELDLVFCNTCVSAQSRARYADEPFGVPMSLALAGVPCVIGSLWNVWYEAGRSVLQSFFQLRRKESRQVPAAIALQQALLSTREVFHDPFHWGGWLLYGDWI